MKLKNMLLSSAIMTSELFALDTNASDKTTIKTATDGNVSEAIQSSVEVVDQLTEYSSLITHSLYFNIFGVLTLRYDIGKRIIDDFRRFQKGLFYQFFFGWDF